MMAYFPMIKRFAQKRAWSIKGDCILDADDFLSIGMAAVGQAIDKFDSSRKTAFPTFAGIRIFGAFNDAIREVDFVPRLTRQRMKSGEERHVNRVSLETTRYHNDMGRAVTIADGVADPQSTAGTDQTDARDSMLRILLGLSKQFRDILYLYHGEGLTMKEIGRSIGISESRVSQLHNTAMSLLRVKIARGELDEDGQF